MSVNLQSLIPVAARGFIALSFVLGAQIGNAESDHDSYAMNEAAWILHATATESKRPAYSPKTAIKFKEKYHVFLKSVLAIDFTYRNATVQLPLYRGVTPSGRSIYYILTEASDYHVAKRMGLNYAPSMKAVIGSRGAQNVTLDQGVVRFRGDVDFSPVHKVVPGDDRPFPPKLAKPGAVADSEWSSFVVLPSGLVLNAQPLYNSTGKHDRVKKVDLANRTVTVLMLDGYQGGRQYFYHLVTDVSAELPAALENGVLAPKLAFIPKIGTAPGPDSAVFGFSPVLNGMTEKNSGEEQGFEASIANQGIDPINVFPFGPRNNDRSEKNGYSPMWDAHVSMWTDAAVTQGRVRRIKGFGDLRRLIEDGWVTSAYINPPGVGNQNLFGLRPTQALINCPVIAHPELPER